MKKILLPTFLLLFSIFLNAQTIAEIQGTGDASPFDGQSVTTTGIVTAVAPQGYFIQDGIALRSGIYIYEQNNSPALGDEVTLTGMVTEFFELTEIVDLTSFSINSSNNALPDPISVSTGDASNENYEGMLVTVQNATCTNTDIGFGEWQVNDGSGALAIDDLMYLFSPDLNIDYGVTGILTYSFSAYKIEPRSMDDVEIQIPLYFTVAPKESNITTSSLTVTWETNIPANSKLSYGLTDALELGTLENLAMSTTHEVVLENLSPATIYYVKPFSEDGAEVTPSQTLVMATASNSSGEMKVYFNHSVDHSVATDELAIYTPNIVDTIISYIDAAQQTLDITMYEAENQPIVDAINAADDRGVTVRVISDDMGTNEFFDGLNSTISYLEGNATGIMHDKFFIIDRENVDNAWVLTGSMNHTVNNLGWDYNNIITIQDQSLARAYTLEFQEMWGSDGAQFDLANSKFGNEKSDNTPHHFLINNIPVELYFSPTDGTAQRITEAIDAAESELAFAVLVFTENSLGTAVKNAYDRGVTTQGIIDYVEFNGSEYDFLLANNIDVQDYQNDDGSQWPDGPTLHHKYAIVDYAQGSSTPLLITGSHNWSASANSIHDENTLLIYDHTLANIYYQEFSARFQGFTDATNDLKISPLEISPNPFAEQLNFEVPENGNLVVSDLAGRILFQQKISEGSNRLNTENWMSGIYFVKFVGENTQRIGKVVKR
ncbi:MAG: phospholipase D-like domain-containing protein [Saprospiraceae bacterium]